MVGSVDSCCTSMYDLVLDGFDNWCLQSLDERLVDHVYWVVEGWGQKGSDLDWCLDWCLDDVLHIEVGLHNWGVYNWVVNEWGVDVWGLDIVHVWGDNGVKLNLGNLNNWLGVVDEGGANIVDWGLGEDVLC